ncbi:glycosyltransferase family 2 protein (plasmid) [Tundrisphaera lichenicola]|uniref:glycosyltransferase family 2 protein n=1 Tax=Tundrisphaera lichenicola TaxID=2029860 RepID=UPI003EC025D7
MNLLIVIVNYRSADLTVDCLRSLESEVAGRPGSRVVVVENASGDDSAERLNSAIRDYGWDPWVSLVSSPRNGGFAAGNNVALAPALSSDDPPELIWLLNPDTMVRPGAMGALVDFLARHPEVGLAGSRLEHLDGKPQNSAFRFPSVYSELEGGLRFGPVSKVLDRHVLMPPVSEVEGPVDWVAGASLMVRREVFEAVGLLDDGYFMYFEEVDFCLRANRAGWPCWYVPGSRVIHLVGQSSGVTQDGKHQKRRPRYWFEARRRYFLKNQGRLRTISADLMYALAFATFRVRRAIQRKPDMDPQWMLWDFIRYNFLTVSKR